MSARVLCSVCEERSCEPQSSRCAECRRERQRDQICIRIKPVTAAAIRRAAKANKLQSERLGPALNELVEHGIW